MKEDAIFLIEQIHLWNTQFHETQDIAYLKGFHELMRTNKNRCQLILLKYFSNDVVWVKKDFGQLQQEWLVGVHGQPEHYASHIPLAVLQAGLSEAQLAVWNIS